MNVKICAASAYCLNFAGIREKFIADYGNTLSEYNLRFKDDEVYITVDSLDKLFNLCNAVGSDLIIGKEPKIVIYDDYME